MSSPPKPPSPPPPHTPLLPTSSSSTTFLRPRRRSLLAAFASSCMLLLSSFFWLSLILSSSPSHPHHHPHHHHSHSHRLRFHESAPPPPCSYSPLSLNHLVFGIAGSAHLWPRRKEFVRLWWRPGSMRGHIWLDSSPFTSQPSVPPPSPDSNDLPPIRISEDISQFRYTNPTGHPSGLRIARILAETFQLGHHAARWFVLVDDDAIVNVDNLVAVLSKYDWTEMVYIGGPSESHSANTYFSHTMAFGGGGIAISYPLARAIEGIQDECLERYPRFYGSDDRLHACISELGVPLTREYGFHQWDIRGNPFGLLAAHPIAPFISIHHVEIVDPVYPGLNSLESLQLFTKAMKAEPMSFLQRAICYDEAHKLSISVSLGYVVQVYPTVVFPRDLERSEVTYTAWNRHSQRTEFDFDTRDAFRSICKKPVRFFLREVWKEGNVTKGSYARERSQDDLKRKVFCFPRSPPLPGVNEILVFSDPLSKNWHLAPRRLCCELNHTVDGTLTILVRQCQRETFGSAADTL
ncbi:Beta-1,3-glucosyltransferase [Carex littledalei]|uniref:Beta-1,3-glucosyltransferase n=1 Tax=Carex littledalei TaxID=544730 RepID=A0A833QDK0_9POAL|nr:Beta-1,3-glucosyltransferase [Carex littledalei]